MMTSSPENSVNCKTSKVPKCSWRSSASLVVCGCVLIVGIGLAGCDKAKELADNAVNKVKKDFEKAKDEVKNASKPNVKNKKNNDVAYDRPKENSGTGTGNGNSTQPQANAALSIDGFLRLGSTKVEDKHIVALAKDPSVAAKVTELDLSGAKISAAGLEVLTQFPNLEKLDMTRTAACVGNMAIIGKVKTLKVLHVDFIPLSDIDFKGISTLSNLEEINITSTRITDEGFRCFEDMPKLQFMLMDRMGHLQGRGFKWVNKDSIREIRANGSSIGLNAFQSIGGSPSLEILWLNGARVTDQAMQGIGRCPNLKELRVEKNDLTNKGISYLKNHKALERVVLAGNRRLNNQALGFLTKTKTLKMVNVHDTQCSQEVEAEFLKHVPGCKLVF